MLSYELRKEQSNNVLQILEMVANNVLRNSNGYNNKGGWNFNSSRGWGRGRGGKPQNSGGFLGGN